MFVFDFDKTLTNHDTLFGFYKKVNKGKFRFYLKRLILIGCAIFYKLKLIDNSKLKRIGVYLFLKGTPRSKIIDTAREYATEINLNSIYHQVYLSHPLNERCIISASFTDYLVFIFPGETVFGSELEYQDNVVKGLRINMYGNEKANQIKRMGLSMIDTVYTDSYSDSYLMDIALNVCLVKDGNIVRLNTNKF